MDSVSTIGRGTVVRGSVRGEGDLEILGRVEGSVAVDGDLSIGEGALIKSDVSGRRVTVSGAVAGNVTASEAIVLEAGARVVGDLGAPQIGIRPGALVRGMVSTHGAGHEGALAAAPAVARTPVRAATRAPVTAAVPSPRPAPVRPAPRPPAVPVRRAGAGGAPAQTPAARTEPVDDGELAHEARTPVKPPPHAVIPPAVDEGPHAPAPVEIHPPEEARAERATESGPPPPIVPQIRKGAKASLRRKTGH
jgi:cytoskeletal protein CcmA (bactofilin family)